MHGSYKCSLSWQQDLEERMSASTRCAAIQIMLILRCKAVRFQISQHSWSTVGYGPKVSMRWNLAKVSNGRLAAIRYRCKIPHSATKVSISPRNEVRMQFRPILRLL